MRKLYVALTRARHATWLGLAPLEGLEHSAIGRLVASGQPLPPEALRPALEALGDAAHDSTPSGTTGGTVVVSDAPEVDTTPVPPDDDEAPLAPARRPQRTIREHWWIASYSALGYSSHSDSAMGSDDSAPTSRSEPTTPSEESAREVHDEPRDSGAMPVNKEPASEGSLHAFPRGPSAGTFLHGLLEWAGQHGFSRVAEDAPLRDETLARRANRRGWENQIPALAEWLPSLLSAELPVPNSQRKRRRTTPRCASTGSRATRSRWNSGWPPTGSTPAGWTPS
ncbi:RecBCD enzyme subunit RecB [Halomonas elongata]|uniref:RecBCD enzyme subunit RecB n=1 Tax=Halomonas elongata TaxID=2746 RepID=A0A1B8P6G1_HALEL|nr:hypothetical protein [Halomonas elongata]OBX37856.1 RecBCD enzyme subunit RecB [Halomonas elongata]